VIEDPPLKNRERKIPPKQGNPLKWDLLPVFNSVSLYLLSAVGTAIALPVSQVH